MYDKEKTIFFDVDTQNDFLNEDGALYVPGAKLLKPNLKALTDYATKNGIIIHGCVDNHFDEDEELSKNGGPFPDHCMAKTEGQKKIPETLTSKEIYVESGVNGFTPLEWWWTGGVMGQRNHMFFEKQTYDVMQNRSLWLLERHMKRISSNFNDLTAIVYGVATDYCVKAAALGLKSFGMDVYVVEDAIKEITLEGKLATFEEFKNAGINLINIKKVIGGI